MGAEEKRGTIERGEEIEEEQVDADELDFEAEYTSGEEEDEEEEPESSEEESDQQEEGGAEDEDEDEDVQSSPSSITVRWQPVQYYTCSTQEQLLLRKIINCPPPPLACIGANPCGSTARTHGKSAEGRDLAQTHISTSPAHLQTVSQ